MTVMRLLMRLRALLRTNTYLFALVLTIGLFIANVVVLPEFASVGNWDTNLITFAPFAMLAVAMGAILFGYIADEEAKGRRIEWLEEPLAMAGKPAEGEEVRLRKAA